MVSPAATNLNPAALRPPYFITYHLSLFTLMAPLCKGSWHFEAVTEGLPPHQRFAPISNSRPKPDSAQSLPLRGRWPEGPKGGRRLYQNFLPACVQCCHTRQHSISARCGPLQPRFARQLPQRGSLFLSFSLARFSGFRPRPTRAVGDAGPYKAQVETHP